MAIYLLLRMAAIRTYFSPIVIRIITHYYVGYLAIQLMFNANGLGLASYCLSQSQLNANYIAIAKNF